MHSLDDFPFAHCLSPSELSYLKEHAKKISVPKDTILFYQEDICQDILLLSQGEIELYMYGDNEKKIS